MNLDIGVKESFGFGLDPIVIRKFIAGQQGGVLLDVSDYNEEYIRAGQIIIKKSAADATERDIYKPLNIKDGAYEALPEGYEYDSVVVASKLTKEPLVATMYNGEVNDLACPYPLTAEIRTALKEAVPTLSFKHD